MRQVILAGLAIVLFACSNAPGGSHTIANLSALIEQPALSVPRAAHAQVRTTDAILLIGGCVRDGCQAGPGTRTVEIINSGDPRMRATGSLVESRLSPAAAELPGGMALIVGGWVDGRVTATTEIFDPQSRMSRPGPTMREPRNRAAITRLADGRVLIAGGDDGARATSSAEIFDPATGELSPTGSLVSARTGATATLLPDGRVLIGGGAAGPRRGNRVLASAELFDPATGSFSSAGQLAQRRQKHGAVALPSGDVLFVGGSDERDYGGKLRSVERYDWRQGRFVHAGALVEARFKIPDAVIALASGQVLVVGGAARAELFDPATGESTLLDGDMGGNWNFLTATPLGEQAAFVAGGYSEGEIRVSNRSWILQLHPIS